jgi:tetratricopeptide (TPR) repeat protein
MAALKPGLASYTRVAYARELLGRPGDAIAAMRLAVDAGAGGGENVAWTLIQLGNLYFDTGRLGPAARAYRAALRRLPTYVHAEAGLARVAAARGETGRSVSLYRRAITKVPLPQYVIGLGDVLRVAGRAAEARRAYALVGAIERLFAANGVRTELETAFFDLDHARDVHAALARARLAFRAAPSINADDVLAWALYKSGRCVEAERHSERALRLGTRDALKLFHRGMIERCVGRLDVARSYIERALTINPHFSLLYAPVARRLVR